MARKCLRSPPPAPLPPGAHLLSLVTAAGADTITALDVFGLGGPLGAQGALTDDDLGQLFEALPNLRFLALGGALGEVSDAALGHLGRCCKKLTHLHISSCR